MCLRSGARSIMFMMAAHFPSRPQRHFTPTTNAPNTVPDCLNEVWMMSGIYGASQKMPGAVSFFSPFWAVNRIHSMSHCFTLAWIQHTSLVIKPGRRVGSRF